MYSWWPWQPPSQFHDDHHVHFHVNYGQNMGVWDRIFGTYRRQGRRYGVEVFGGQGAALSASENAVPNYIDYSREAVEASVRALPARAAR
jgi:lathosterol oxidase